MTIPAQRFSRSNVKRLPVARYTEEMFEDHILYTIYHTETGLYICHRGNDKDYDPKYKWVPGCFFMSHEIWKPLNEIIVEGCSNINLDECDAVPVEIIDREVFPIFADAVALDVELV